MEEENGEERRFSDPKRKYQVLTKGGGNPILKSSGGNKGVLSKIRSPGRKNQKGALNRVHRFLREGKGSRDFHEDLKTWEEGKGNGCSQNEGCV